ncbi:NAD(P)-binding protein [Methanonatronarchaeum sp. AMET-Sl]|uniref:NAD(P)/FAD-dependent oxidoreductase n=1 Tax=Methanonatronarchaeum sp. AMET-Sl TaxID=3037654 RepID=UPI00244E354E|nr:NAD(P)-binding protein [Methanonatronarchaeum sp. AMET-Sl]WGI17544.1 NAD(P)-binding protein [Methanonatronarchaeum sp. AMET-Sl]
MDIGDVGVVGGGLSGLLTARYIDRLCPDIEVRVFERRSRDRYRVDCGGGFIDLRGELGRVVDEVRPFVSCMVDRSLWRFSNGSNLTEVCFKHDDFFWIIDRLGWQKKILNDIEGSVDVVFDMEVEPGSLDFDLVVDASGAKYQVATAVYGVYKGDFSSFSGKAVFDYKKGLNGYYWLFPLESGYANIGYGDFGGEIREQMLDRYIESLPVDVESKESGGGGYFDYTYFLKDVRGKRNKLVQKRDGGWLARVGDAAGIMDPLTGEGIGGAVSSSYHLAKSIKKGNLEKYPNRIKRHNNHSIRLKMARHRTENYHKFVKKISTLDGVNASDCYKVPKFLLKHPIRSIKFLFA